MLTAQKTARENSNINSVPGVTVSVFPISPATPEVGVRLCGDPLQPRVPYGLVATGGRKSFALGTELGTSAFD